MTEDTPVMKAMRDARRSHSNIAPSASFRE
jgi:hypothetical protein